MDFGTQPRTTFIPKSPVVSNTPSGYRHPRVPIASLLSIIIFIASIALSGGLYMYKGYLKQSLSDKQASLAKARAAFEPEFIEELKRLDRRIEHSKNIIGRHSALSSFFDVLGRATLQNVQFRSIRLSANPQGSGFNVSLSGLARSYASVALQSDEFGKAPGVKNPIFSQLNLGQSGNVLFSVAATLDPEAFKYSGLLSESGNLDDQFPLEESFLNE